MKFPLLICFVACIDLALSLTTIVIPAYNEEHRLPIQTLLDFLKRRQNTSILVVDDGSTDNTFSLVKSKETESLQIMKLQKNSGKAEAVRRGMIQAFAEGADFIGFWDADLATPLSALDDFEKEIEMNPNIEMVFGARVALLGRNIQRHTSRHYLGRIFATLASTLLNLTIYDTQCGSKLFKATDDLRVVLSQPFMSPWIFDVELIARFATLRRHRMLQEGCKNLQPIENVIYECPLKTWEDVAGSKIFLKDKIRALEGLYQIWFRYYSPDWITGPKQWPPSSDSWPQLTCKA